MIINSSLCTVYGSCLTLHFVLIFHSRMCTGVHTYVSLFNSTEILRRIILVVKLLRTSYIM